LKILLTGATGFVGSHILDELLRRGLPTAVLLRAGSNTSLIQRHLSNVEARRGSFEDEGSLAEAVKGCTHVLHCAGCIKALKVEDFYRGNQLATRHLASAFCRGGGAGCFVLISSLAAAGPSARGAVRRFTDPDGPVSEYGKSKLAGEREVKERLGRRYVILRPPAVYGPRDTGFLPLFKSARSHLVPGSNQELSLVYVQDLAKAAVESLFKPAAAGRTWFVAGQERVTAREFGTRIGMAMGVRTFPLPLPNALLRMMCSAADFRGRMTGKPNVLNRYKMPELCAPAWTCDPEPLRKELHIPCPTTLDEGIRETVAWYSENGLL
jgi:nucleoside-diphosphate-sugar epimerase